MKQFPRIYSLSTIGLIHHREFDYLFNAFRTDFIGESGSGKSMIADLIQLILVGHEVFESSTKGNDIRDPEGMVLRSDLNDKGIGYAFLNIEMGPQRFLAIGVYIETGVTATQAFVIQAGYEWANLDYLTTPLTFRQLLKDDEILNIDLLKDHLDSQGFHIKFWLRLKEYHRLLYRERLVPLDLAATDRILRDYAGILQAFSRGKNLDTQKSDSLKQFLFGNLDAKRIMDNFKKSQKDMEQAIDEYGNNLKEIEKVTTKQQELLRLREAKTQMDNTRNEFLYKSILFYYQENKRFSNEITENLTAYLKAHQYQRIMKNLLEEEIIQLLDILPSLTNKKDEADSALMEIAPDHNQIRQIENILHQLNCSFEELQSKHKSYKNDREQYIALTNLQKSLKEKYAEDTFENIPNKSSIGKVKEYLITPINDSQKKIAQKKRLQAFSNINDPKSLAYWALQQKRQFSLTEESAIISFQSLPRDQPIDFSDYLPDPSELIFALNKLTTEKEGFWINLNGIHKFIPYVKEQILNTTDENIIRSYFDTYTHTLINDITQLERQLTKLKSVSEVLDDQSNPDLSLQAYHRKVQLQNFKEISILELSPERLKEYEHLYTRRDSIHEQFQQAKNKQRLAEQELRSTQKQKEEYSDILNNNPLPVLLPELQSVVDGESVNCPFIPSYEQEKKNVSATLSRQSNKPGFLRSETQSTRKPLENIYQLPGLINSREDCLQKLSYHKTWYLKFNPHLPESLDSKAYISDPAEKEKNLFIKAETQYTTTYSAMITQFIPSELYRLEEDKDFVQMAKTLLPEAFHDKVLDESESNIVETIASYLIKINEKNRQLNNRKIQKIKELLNEVDEMITQQENSARRIDNFLRGGAQITGGYKARLHRRAAVNYPKVWMTQFRDLLENQQHAENLHDKLGEKIDLEDMMMAAFFSCGGSPSAKPSAQKLLDPTNYYELFFTMESESGRVNKGSTGQTYAAISLLCIARLSILSSDENKKIEPAVRIIPIDEAEGLGSNYDMLYDIAQKYDYQLLSLSIGPVGKFKDGEQYLYMIHKNMEIDQPINYTPIAILSESDKISNGVIYEQS